MIDWQSGHSNVDRGLGRIPLWIALQNRPILQRSLGEQHDVYIMMKFRLGGSRPPEFATTHSVILHSITVPREGVISAFSLFRTPGL